MPEHRHKATLPTEGGGVVAWGKGGPDTDFDIAALDALEKAGLAKKFDIDVPWTETFPVSPLQGTWTGAP